ncbi:MAG: YkgJ family cysteine cluster protein [Bacteroidetes bacterium]|nr:YkgJ family cysteine cluster protein [Bacteroidota bacterium]
MNKKSEIFARYHDSFAGDTYDACARCGGKCEKFKISTLMPGEKQFMADKLGKTLAELEEGYLSVINTPYGNVDVLKMKTNCNFLDEEYRCTAFPAKPVLCDTYPVVFFISKGKVRFEIDKVDCPMVHWPEYKMAVKDFETNGIRAIKELKVPFSWWKKVTLFDEFDVDYQKIELELAKTGGYEEFYLEEIFGYACNGYEKRARKRGILLLIERQRQAVLTTETRLAFKDDGIKKAVSDLARGIRSSLKSQLKDVRQILENANVDEALISAGEGSEYRSLVKTVLHSFRRIQEETERVRKRLAELQKRKDNKIKTGLVPSVLLGPIDDKFFSANFKRVDDFQVYQLFDERTQDFRNAYRLLAQTFFTDEIDTPIQYEKALKQGRSPGSGSSRKGIGRTGKNLWARWLMVILKDTKNRVVGVADGAVLYNFKISTFYASHIAVDPTLRSMNLGTVLTAAMAKAADNELSRFAETLPSDLQQQIIKTGLLSEVGEVEFPEDLNAGSMSNRRLVFHGRLDRSVLWPARYAQMDTDYQLKEFDPGKWNSVPMFLCYRAFAREAGNPKSALLAADLLFDYFIFFSDSNAAWDKKYFTSHLKKDGDAKLIPMPKDYAELQRFINKTGLRKSLLTDLYKNHLYTKTNT